MDISRRSLLAAGTTAGALAVQARAASRKPGGPKPAVRRIATEEAFCTDELLTALFHLLDGNLPSLDLDVLARMRAQDALQRALALEGERLGAMDEAGIDMQLLSLASPGVQILSADLGTAIAASSNDALAATIARHPTRFAGLGTFAAQDPQRAVKEIDRAINGLRLNGFLINSHTNGEYLDQKKFWPILEALEALDAPLYIHPRAPGDGMAKICGEYGLASAPWGFQAETSIHALRMIFGGVFDRFPKLRIVLGHMGENLPFHLWRIDRYWRKAAAPIQMKPSDYFLRNFYVTTSGFEDPLALKFVIDKLGIDRVMWAVDYPYEKNGPAVEFMDAAPVTEVERAKLYHLNAERIFKITPGAPVAPRPG